MVRIQAVQRRLTQESGVQVPLIPHAALLLLTITLTYINTLRCDSRSAHIFCFQGLKCQPHIMFYCWALAASIHILLCFAGQNRESNTESLQPDMVLFSFFNTGPPLLPLIECKHFFLSHRKEKGAGHKQSQQQYSIQTHTHKVALLVMWCEPCDSCDVVIGDTFQQDLDGDLEAWVCVCMCVCGYFKWNPHIIHHYKVSLSLTGRVTSHPQWHKHRLHPIYAICLCLLKLWLQAAPGASPTLLTVMEDTDDHMDLITQVMHVHVGGGLCLTKKKTLLVYIYTLKLYRKLQSR